MIDDGEVRRAAAEALRELGMEGWRVEVKPAMAAPNAAARQLRLHDPEGGDRAVVVSFEDEAGAVVGDYKPEVRRQLEALKAG